MVRGVFLRSLLTVGGIALIVTLAGCKAPADPRRTNFEVRGKEGVAKFDPKTGKLTRLEFDKNKNGKMDSTSYMDGTRVIRIEMDNDEDGKIDRWEFYGENNKIARVGTSSRDDEVQDTYAYPDATGFLAKVEFDTNRDGTIDKRDHYVPRPGRPEERVLSIVEYEFNQVGEPRRRLYYGTDGNFQKSEVLR